MYDDNDDFVCFHAYRNPAIFILTMLIIVNRDGKRIKEDLRGTLKTNAMFLEILFCFYRIPIKTILH